MTKLASFYYLDKLYFRLIPSKQMFRSTMVHDVVNRGDVFAMRTDDQQFTVISGQAEVQHVTVDLEYKTAEQQIKEATPVPDSLKKLRDQFALSAAVSELEQLIMLVSTNQLAAPSMVRELMATATKIREATKNVIK